MSAKTKKKKAVPAGVDPNASSKETYDWIQCLLVALIICVLSFILFTALVKNIKARKVANAHGLEALDGD